ncbi:MAG TPA: dihydroorotate dehydrogenase electron transfer subunit [Chloroflexota bacterium]|nr:dihydroorotate dehydrogenase electron transfer subunit [Chloroflexota bacterium]
MELVRARVVANEAIMPDTHVLHLESAELGRAAAPGQFVHIRCGPTWEPLLRRPMSVYRIRREGVSLMVRAVGEGSAIIAASQPGEVVDCLGPLGKPFTVAPTSRRLVMLGGGYGVAPLVALAEHVLPRGREVVLLVGAATADYVFPADLVPPEVEYQVATMDGSLGHAGYVTELLPPYLDWADGVYACGPTPMLAAVSRAALTPRNALVPSPLSQAWRSGPGGAGSPPKPVQLAMEQHMGCAMGVCLGCVVRTRHGYQRVCRDGPVFSAEELCWEELA